MRFLHAHDQQLIWSTLTLIFCSAAWPCVSSAGLTRGYEDGVVMLQGKLDIRYSVRANPGSMRRVKLRRERGAQQNKASYNEKRQIMVNYDNTEYITYMTIGHQTIAGIVDTGSFELVVFLRECTTCGRAAKYDYQQSPTHRLGLLVATQSYGSGETQSAQASDLVSLGPYKGKNQTFWEVDRASMPILDSAEFQAIIGIGPPETPAADAWEEVQTQLNIVDQMLNNSETPSGEMMQEAEDSFNAAVELSSTHTMLENFGVGTFSVCLGAEPGSDGYIIWNDTSAFDAPSLFRRVPILGKHTWSVQLSDVRWRHPEHSHHARDNAGTGIHCTESQHCTALMDSGTSLLVVPSSVVNKIQDVIKTMDANCSNLHLLPDLVFTLNGQEFSLPPDSYVAEVTDEDLPDNLHSFIRIRHIQVGNHTGAKAPQCRVLLMESNEESHTGPIWIFGMPFFRKYYTSFHIGESHDSRALYIADAADDCTPAQGAAPMRSKPHVRRITPSRLHAPPVVKDRFKALVDL